MTSTQNTADKMTEVMLLLIQEKPQMFAANDNPVLDWKKHWLTLIHELPTMWKRKEEWIYYNWRAKGVMAGTDAQIQDEFKSLLAQGLEVCDDTDANELKPFCILSHPKLKKKGLRCEFQFKRFANEKNEGMLCPVLWGIGVIGDGFTYVNVKFSEVDLPKSSVKMTMDLLNGKF